MEVNQSSGVIAARVYGGIKGRLMLPLNGEKGGGRGGQTLCREGKDGVYKIPHFLKKKLYFNQPAVSLLYI